MFHTVWFIMCSMQFGSRRGKVSIGWFPQGGVFHTVWFIECSTVWFTGSQVPHSLVQHVFHAVWFMFVKCPQGGFHRVGCSTQFGSSSVPQFGSHLFRAVWFMFVKVHRVVSTGWDVPHSLVHRVFHSLVHVCFMQFGSSYVFHTVWFIICSTVGSCL